MQRKFFMYPNYLLGLTTGRPIEVLQAQAANVGILAIILMVSYCLSCYLLRSQSDQRKADKAPTTPTMMAIGWAQLLKPLQNQTIFQLSIISPMMACQNLLSYVLEGSYPQRSKQQLYTQVECQANSSILQPRYISSPQSPFMQVMPDMQLAVHVNPGSYVVNPVLLWSPRISRRQSPIVPFRTGIQYYLPSYDNIAFSHQVLGYLGIIDFCTSESFRGSSSIYSIFPANKYLKII